MSEREKLEKRINGLGEDIKRQIEEKRAAMNALVKREAEYKAARAKKRAELRLREDKLKRELFKRG
jgi:hypothetical protein